jgi:serine/threonine protein kinase
LNRAIADDFLQSFEGLELPDALSARYAVAERLSENDVGETYLLAEKDGGKLFVMKCYKKGEGESESREAKLLCGLHHKGIPEFEKEYENADTFFVVREYAEGICLDKYMVDYAGIDEPAVLNVAGQICDVLSYLHSQPSPIIHRDIKPTNIIINPENNSVKLIDFGISRKYAVTAETDTESRGTREFAPPEQYGFSQTDCRSDLYSLGVVMRYLMKGSVKGEVDRKGFRRIIEKCTAFSPDDRYKSAEALKRDLIKYKNRMIRVAIQATLSLIILLGIIILCFYIVEQTDFFKPNEENASGGHVEDTYVFHDASVENAVRVALGKSEYAPVYRADLLDVTSLYFIGEKGAYDATEYFEYGTNYDGETGTLTNLSDLRYMDNLQAVYITLQPLEDLSPLSSCDLLEYVYLADCPNLEDISPLAFCQKIHSVYLSNSSISDISPLTDLPSLSNLRVFMMDRADLSSLQDMDSLRVLHIGFVPVRSLTELGNLDQVNELIIHDTLMENLDGIESFASLTMVNLASCDTVRDFSALNKLPGLRNVFINPGMEDDFNATVTRKDMDVTIIDDWSKS